jgi:hypothetical protein
VAVDQEGMPRSVPKPQGKPKGGKTPRKYGDSVERAVAKATSGKRVPMSGAAKAFATGDVEIPDASGKPFLKLEVKARGTINSKGEKSITFTKPVIDQAKREAEAVGELAVLWGHYKGESTVEGVAAMPVSHFLQLMELAKLGRTLIR